MIRPDPTFLLSGGGRSVLYRRVVLPVCVYYVKTGSSPLPLAPGVLDRVYEGQNSEPRA